MENLLILDWSTKKAQTVYFNSHETSKFKSNLNEVFFSMPTDESKNNFLLISLLENNSMRHQAKFINTYLTALNFNKSRSYRIALRVLLFGQIKNWRTNFSIKDLILMFEFSKLYLYVAAILGILKVPKIIIFATFKFYSTHIYNFLAEINNLGIQFIIIRDTGRSNFYYLTYFLPKKIKVLDILYGWDNSSIKYFPSSNVTHIATWNTQQIQEIKRVCANSSVQFTTVGSHLADITYLKYSALKSRNIAPYSKEILVIGMFNQTMEVMELINIKKFMNQLVSSHYSGLVYRPHPDSSKSIKLFNKSMAHTHGIKLSKEASLDFRDFSAVICFPTSMLLEVIVSRVPAILFAPKHKRFRTDPFTVYQMDHFKLIREIKPLTVSHNINDLKNVLASGIPNQNPLDNYQFSQIFPNFHSEYSDRILKLASTIFE